MLRNVQSDYLLWKRGNTISNTATLAKIPQMDVKLELDDPPTGKEIKKATMQLKVGKSPDIEGIPAEVLSAWGRSSAR